jgi:hypothetical protein
MSNIMTEIFNAGETPVPLKKPNNVTSFLLTEDECAVVNAINLQSTALKTMMVTVMSVFEEQLEQQMRVLASLRNQFIAALAQKHNLVIGKEDGGFDIDLVNKLMLYSPTDKDEQP